jgi:hypothetical protein
MPTLRLVALLALTLTAACHRDWDALFAGEGGVAVHDAGVDAGHEAEAAREAEVEAAREAEAPPAGPVASWPLDEGSGTTAHDVTGNGHDGAILGTHAWIQGRTGSGSSALSLDGVGYVSVANCSGFDRPPGATFTMSAWILRPQLTDGGPLPSFVDNEILSVSYSSSNNFGMEVHDPTHISYWDGEPDDPAQALGVIDFGTMWHHVAIVVDEGVPVATSYVDGTLGTSSQPDTTMRSCEGVILGGSNFGDRLPAAIADVRYYAAALNASQILYDMNH